MDKEIAEAINAANDALYHLELARDKLKSAKRFGILDIVGGGLIISMIKRGRIGDAGKELRAASAAISSLREELRDVNMYLDTDLKGFDSLGFMETMFDNVFLDFIAQGKINEALENVAEATGTIEGILDALSDLA